jgi:lactonase
MNKKTKKSLVLIPPQEASLPIIMAEKWLQIVPDPHVVLEGPAFDREGNLFVTSVIDGRVYKITPNKKMSIIFNNNAYMPGDCAIHKDGRLFLACVSGQVIIINPDGSNLTEIKARYEGKPFAPDGIVFDSGGNFYVTDLGNLATSVGTPTGGVYRFSADLKAVHPIIQNLGAANGIALAPKGVSIPSAFPVAYELWVAESCLNRLIHIRLQEDGITPSHPPANVAYYFLGDVGPDSNAIDAEGNLYQTIAMQGRILILNKAAIPVAQVLVPGRDEGKNLLITNLAFKPGTEEGYITLGGTEGGWVFKFRWLAKGLELFSHQ